MKKISAALLMTLMVGVFSTGAYAENARELKQDVKEAGKKTGHAIGEAGKAVGRDAKAAGLAIASGAKKAGHAVADTTRRGYDKTKEFVTDKK